MLSLSRGGENRREKERKCLKESEFSKQHHEEFTHAEADSREVWYGVFWVPGVWERLLHCFSREAGLLLLGLRLSWLEALF